MENSESDKLKLRNFLEHVNSMQNEIEYIGTLLEKELGHYLKSKEYLGNAFNFINRKFDDLETFKFLTQSLFSESSNTSPKNYI